MKNKYKIGDVVCFGNQDGISEGKIKSEPSLDSRFYQCTSSCGCQGFTIIAEEKELFTTYHEAALAHIALMEADVSRAVHLALEMEEKIAVAAEALSRDETFKGRATIMLECGIKKWKRWPGHNQIQIMKEDK